MLQCMLIHGLGGTPLEMRYIAAALEAAGLETHSLTLPGHDARVTDYLRVSYADWREHVLAEHARLAARGPVLSVGFSLGGLLTLDLAEQVAEHCPLAGMALLAAPVRLFSWHPFFMVDWRLPFAGLVRRLMPVVHYPARSEEQQAVAPWRGYDGITVTRHVADMLAAMRRVRAGLGRITAPALIWQARGDMTCRAWNAFHIARRLGSADVTLRLVDIRNRQAGHHLLPTHVETREPVAASVRDFAVRLTGACG